MKASLNININLNVNTVPQLMAALNALKRKEILVGVPGQGAHNQRKPDEETGKASPIDNVNLAYVQNNGSAAAGIPGMHFMEKGIEEAKPAIIKRLKDAGSSAIDGNVDAMEKNFEAAGIEAVTSIKNVITRGDFVPLKPATIAARKRKGKNSTKRGVVTGQMRDSIESLVRDV